MKDKALLFINGEPPKKIPEIDQYHCIGCTDGAARYLLEMNFPMSEIDFISGDFDSISDVVLRKLKNIPILHTPDQDKTDFHKALDILVEKGMKKVEVFGGSGKEQDHFLGNISVAYYFKSIIEIRFIDLFSEYYFISPNTKLSGVFGKTISLYPFPEVKNITSKGLFWPLENDSLSITSKIGTRNKANLDEVSITYESGDVLLFVEK